MAQGTQDSEDIISGINVTPLVDIVLVVLIIFIVTASFVFRNAIEMELPKAQTAEQSTAGLLNVALTAQGQVYINGKPGELEDLEQAVKTAASRLEKEGSQKKVSAFVSADVKTQYGAFAAVVDQLRLAGVSDIALDTQPVEIDKDAP